jgi:hypothetical protein
MRMISEILFTDCDSIFVNDNGEQASFEGDGKVKRALEFLGGKALLPSSFKIETDKNGVQENTIHETTVNGDFLYITLTKYHHLRK